MYRFWLVLLFLIVVNTTVSAQVHKNYLELSLGLNDYQTKDMVLNNIKHSGKLLFLGFDYEIPRERSRQKLEFDFVFNMLNSRYESEKSSYVFYPELNYSYDRKLNEGIKNLDIFIGGNVGTEYHMTFYENWDEAHLYWLTSYYLGINGFLLYKKSQKLLFYFRPDFPVLSLISRPPSQFMQSEISGSPNDITKSLHDNLRLVTFNRHFACKINLGLMINHSKSFSPSVFWRVEYIMNRMPYSKDIQIVSQTFGISFKF